MIAALLLAAAVSAPARAATVKIFAFDEKGAPLGLPGLLSRLARADDKTPDPDKPAFWAFPLDEKTPPARVRLKAVGPLLTAAWPGGRWECSAARKRLPRWKVSTCRLSVARVLRVI